MKPAWLAAARRKRRPLLIGALVAAVIGTVVTDRWLRPYDLAAEQAAARAEGIPLTSAELTRPRPPAEQDAAPDWLALTALLRRNPLDDTIRDAMDAALSPGASAPPPDSQEIHRRLAARPDVTELVHRIASRSGAYFPHTWRAAEEYPYATVMRLAGEWLRLESLDLAHSGRYEEAVRAQALGFRVADHAAMDPIVISYLVGAASEADALEGMAAILRLAGPNARIAAAVRRAIEENPSRLDLTYVMKAEPLFALTELRAVRSFDDYYALIDGAAIPLVYYDPPLPPDAPRPSSRPNGLVRRYLAEPGEAAFLHRFTPVVRAAALPEGERVGAARRAQRAWADRGPRTPGGGLACIFEFGFAKSFTQGLKTAARRRVTLVAAAIMEHYARTGGLPDRLEAVMPKVPLDPFTGKPLSYRREGAGFAVYSVGDPVAHDRKPIAFRYPPDGG